MSVPIPNAEQSIVDGGLGIVPGSVDGVSVKVGTSTAGSAGFTSYSGGDTEQVGLDLGEGPLPDCVVKNLLQSGGKTTHALKIDASTAGSNSAVTQSGSGPAVALTGDPDDYYLGIAKVITGGQRGTATFQYSLDGGRSYSDTIVTAATYELPNGNTLNFPPTSASMTGSPSDVDFSNAGTITRNTGSFITDGFVEGMVLTISGTSSNNGATLVVTDVAATVLTVTGTVVNETNVNAPTISGQNLYVAGETYSWVNTAPAFTSGDVANALDDIIESEVDPEFVHIIGYPSTAVDAATIAATVATKIAAAWAVKKYFFVVIETPPVDKADVISAFADFAEKAIVVCAGFANIVDDRSGKIEKKNIGRVVTHRIARNPIEVHLLRNVGDTDIDPLPDVHTPLVPPGSVAASGYHDEDKTPGLNAARCTTLRTIAGTPGIYITNGLTMAPGTSDFQQLQYLRIVLKVARAWYAYTVGELARRIRADLATGLMDSKMRISLQASGETEVKNSLGDAIRGVRAVITPTNLNANPTIFAKLRTVVDGYALVWSSQIGLASSLPAAA